jgi:RNA 3'-terminal phosphate cyclase (ATP)
MIHIDGSQGEGGGQILRSSLALSLVTGQPFRMTNIRSGRAKPGLLRQHLTAVQAAMAVGQAEARGVELGSKEIVFTPGEVRGGSYSFAIGSAGSATLVLQTILAPLLSAEEPSEIVIEGGTHNPAAPPYPFLVDAFAPLLARMGAKLALGLDAAGFHPAGGGKLRARIEPCRRLARLEITERGEVKARYVRAIVSKLPAHVAQREIHTLLDRLGWSTADVDARPDAVDSPGPGNALVVTIACANVTEVFTGFGAPDVRAEQVAASTADEAKRWLDAGVPIGEHLADQLVMPMALGGGGVFRTVAPSKHLNTQVDVVRTFLGREITIADEGNGAYRVDVAAG